MRIFNSITNTLDKTLVMTDNILDGTAVVTEMYKDAMVNASFDHKLECFKERKTQIKASGLSPEELAEFLKLIN